MLKQQNAFGNFVQGAFDEDKYLTLDLAVGDIPIKKLWKNNDLSTDMVADYYRTFFSSKQEKQGRQPDELLLENIYTTIKYIANELLENALKFHRAHSSYTLRCCFSSHDDQVFVYVTNQVTLQQGDILQHFIKQLTEEDQDPVDMYIAAMEAQKEGGAGLGLLSMVCDYSAKLGWQLEKHDADEPFITVITMVCIDIKQFTGSVV